MSGKKHLWGIPPYVPGIQPRPDLPVIKLNSNENPYPPSPRVQEAIASFDYARLRKYPDPFCAELRREIADVYGVMPEHVFCGNGSDEIISLTFKAFLEEGDVLSLPYPTYTFYRTAAAIHRVCCRHVPTSDAFAIDPEALVGEETRAVVLVNPNAPTGVLLERDRIEKLLRRFGGLVVVDEAYMDFAEPDMTAVPLVLRYPNLLVIRTMSKSYSLCGARFGYAFGDPRLIALLFRCKDSYNVSALTQAIALAAIRDRDYMRETVARIRRTRDRLTARLRELGFEVVDSQANFVLCRPPGGRAKDLYDYLFRHGVYVRYFEEERLDDKLRISVGTDGEIEVLTELIRKFGNEGDPPCEPP